MYISELELCLKKEHNSNKCNSYLTEISQCSNPFRYIQIDKNKIIDLLNNN